MREAIERAMTQGERVRRMPVARLAEVARELQAFQAQPGLNGFQRWLLDHYSPRGARAHAAAGLRPGGSAR